MLWHTILLVDDRPLIRENDDILYSTYTEQENYVYFNIYASTLSAPHIFPYFLSIAYLVLIDGLTLGSKSKDWLHSIGKTLKKTRIT